MNDKEKFEIKNLPKPFSNNALELNFGKFKDKNPELLGKIELGITKQVSEAIFANSPYLSDLIIKFPEFYISLFESGFEKGFNDILTHLENLNEDSQEGLMKSLRIEKQKASLLIAITEITKIWDIETTTHKLSVFADLCTKKACEFLMKDYHIKQVIELKDVQKPLENSGLVIIALGKLGSNELNYSSDIDLSVFYEDEKLKYLGRQTLAQFYIQFAQELTKILSERTADGYVFRVDMRLRPDPGANPLAVSLKKAEKYYFTVGQNWERAAMIKQRFVCGDIKSGKIFEEFMNRNVFRKTLDFETIEDIHSIKRQIDTKQGVHPNNLYGYNVKLGRGGIREIEFYAQTQQLIWGGRKKTLQKKKTIDALFALAKEGEINEQIAKELKDSYLFLRMVEHRLQMINDEQTHTLPKEKDELEHIAVFCGFKNTDEFLSALHKKISVVRNHYSKLFETSPSLASDLPEASGSLIFTGTENHPDTLDTLKKMGFDEPDRVSDIVRGWHHGRYEVTHKKRARAELTKLMPLLFVAFAKSPDPDNAFSHFDEFLSKLPETSQIFSMLYIRPNILELLAEVFGGYPEIAATLSKNPTLIEYVLEPEFYKTIPDKDILQKNLDKHLKASKGDFEQAIEVVKNWTFDRKFRVGIQLVKDEISTEKIFESLSNIAEVVLNTVIKLTIKDFEKTIGKIEGGKFGVLCFGKFGSKELTFNSDLDVVFVYDFKEDNPKISAASYYIKLASKVVSVLSSVTASGLMYEVDTRLRPAGESGPLATYIKSIDEYYTPKKETSAWVYEYIALTRARAISLDKKFENKIQKLIREKLRYNWDEETLLKEAKYIHEKFSRYKRVRNNLDIKNSEGGLFDLEFLIRFLQLKNLHKNPKIYATETPPTIEKLYKAKVIKNDEYKTIKEAYYFYKEVQNRMRITSETEITKYTEKILCKILNIEKASDLYKKLESIRANIKNLFGKYLS